MIRSCCSVNSFTQPILYSSNGKKVERPKLRWQDNVKRDVERAGLESGYIRHRVLHDNGEGYSCGTVPPLLLVHMSIPSPQNSTINFGVTIFKM